MPLPEIAAALSSLTALKELGSAILGVRDENARAAMVYEFNQAILELQDKLYAARTEREELVSELQSVRRALEAARNWQIERDRYELVELPPSVFVYGLKASAAGLEPAHYVCKTCFEKGTKSVLDGDEQYGGRRQLTCNSCGTKLFIGIRTTHARVADHNPYA